MPRPRGARKSAHVIVVGNEKGGSGKSTIAVHIAVALLNAGQQVVTVDLDSRQKTLTQYIENRRAWAKRSGAAMLVPDHFCIAQANSVRVDSNESAECRSFLTAISMVEHTSDFLVIDTPGTDSYLMRLAHAMADTLITPLNDSFVDFALLGLVDADTYTLSQVSQYAAMIAEAKRKRREVDSKETDWIVMRNRLSNLRSRSRERLSATISELGARLGFRCVDGLVERLVYRDYFPRGLTAMDDIKKAALGRYSARSHQNARSEIESVIAALRLPLNEKAAERALAKMAPLPLFSTLAEPCSSPALPETDLPAAASDAPPLPH
ncbi:MAG TPA: division plane positioning ATPase MipZ [Pseudolabrys sp.]|nr:division plane positioning ATPase MipZ [Pseudolabrys sp.]